MVGATTHPNPKCPEHPTHLLNYYCTDCKKAICEHCAIISKEV